MNGTILNIRVAVLVETPRGYVFERDAMGYYFPVGGRMKIYESSIAAARREISEELGIHLDSMEYAATIENFFRYKDQGFHEICIVHRVRIEECGFHLPYHVLEASVLHEVDIRPAIMRQIISAREPAHFVVGSPGT